MDDRKRRLPFKTKLPVLSNIVPVAQDEKSIKSPMASPSSQNLLKSLKPCHDPFFYISKGQRSKLAPALPPGPGLPRSPPSTRSSKALEPIKTLSRYRSLESLQEPKQIFLRVPEKKRRFAIKNLNPIEKRPHSFRLPTPSFQNVNRIVNSAEEYFPGNGLGLPQEPSRQITSLIPSQYADATFRVIKW